MGDKSFSYGGYTGSIEFSVADGCLFGRIMFIADTILYEAETLPELEAAFHDAVNDYLAYCKEEGLEPDKPYSGTFNVRITPEAHRAAARAAFECDKNLNEWVGAAIQTALTPKRELSINHNHTHRLVMETRSEAKSYNSANSTNLKLVV